MSSKPGTFPKGKSGNPNGRPKKGMALSDILQRLGDEKIEIGRGKSKREVKRKEELARIVWDEAVKKKRLPFITLLFNRIDGLPIQAIKTEENQPFEIVIQRIPRENE